MVSHKETIKNTLHLILARIGFILMHSLSNLNARNTYLIDKKIRLGIAILIIQSSLDLSAQDINRRPPNVRCYKSSPAWGEQINIGVAADYKHGLH